MKKLFISALATSVATVALATMLATSAASAALSFQTLSLLNGWKTYSPEVRAPKVAIDQDGIVHFLGAIKQPSGTDNHAFTLPVQFRPTKITYVVTDQCLAAAGRLEIDPDGQVFVQADTSVAAAQCFTSLEGAQFAK